MCLKDKYQSYFLVPQEMSFYLNISLLSESTFHSYEMSQNAYKLLRLKISSQLQLRESFLNCLNCENNKYVSVMLINYSLLQKIEKNMYQYDILKLTS